MDRATNLTALAEEEEEEPAYLSDDDSENDEKGDGGIRRGEPNKFDSLCDGVLNTLALVHGSLQELQTIKDELMTSALPPNVLTKVALVHTKVFRSVGDMHMPVNELIRMVRIYSTPWEEKSAALKKLHEDYEAKKSQLNIAIKRLQLVDGQSRRMNREKRILHWEKLFCRITAAKGHGRRWKFLIDSFKNKANEGIPALQRYLDDMENASDSEDEDADFDYPVDSQMRHMLPSDDMMSDTERASPKASDDKNDVEESSETPPEPDQPEQDDEPQREPSEHEILVNEDQKSVQSEKEKEEESIFDSNETESKFSSELETLPDKQVEMYIKPPMRDVQVSTEDPVYDRFLYVRVYRPTGMEQVDLKCLLTCGKEHHKTGSLDPNVTSDSIDDNKSDTSDKSKSSKSSDTAPKRKGRGLIGTRGSKGSIQSDSQNSPKEEKKPDPEARYEEMLFTMPEKEVRGAWKPKTSPSSEPPEHMRVAVQYGPRDEMVAMATIDMKDLNSLGLPSVVLPPPADTADVRRRRRHGAFLDSDSDLSDYDEDDEDISPRSTASGDSALQLPARTRDMEPVHFPLYSTDGSRSESVHLPCGQLPLVCFWAKKLRPRKFTKTTEADTLTDIVYDLTGINLEEVTKDELHPDRTERGVSAMSARTPEPTEEMVTRNDYDRLMRTHQEEMEMLQDEYEQRLQDLADSMQHMQVLSFDDSPLPRPPSSGRLRSSSSGRSQTLSRDDSLPHPPREPRPADENMTKSKQRLGKSLPNWGENLPKTFLERLAWFKELTQRHRQELAERTNKEVSANYERRLAGEYKLREPRTESDPLQDVSLPAVFMPSKGRDLTIYNPRASKYFHATGSSNMRLTQPPSMVQLPPLPKNKVNVVNLFDICNNFRRGGNDLMIQQYMQQQQEQAEKQQQEQQQQYELDAASQQQQQAYEPEGQEYQQQMYQVMYDQQQRDLMMAREAPQQVHASGSPAYDRKQAMLE